MLPTTNPKRLNVLFFSHSSQLDGAERSLLSLVEQLIRDHNINCSVVLPDTGPLKSRLEDIGASVIIINYTWWNGPGLITDQENNARLGRSFKNISSKLDELNELNPDVIVTNTIVLPWGAVAAFLLSKPHVWFIREYNITDFQLPRTLILQIVKESSNLILVNSKATREKIFGKTSEQEIPIIYPYVNIPQDTKWANSSTIFPNKDSLKLLNFGSVSENKGQIDAILAVKELRQRNRNVELLIMGNSDPVYLEKLKNIIDSENLGHFVNFLKFQNNPFPVINQADIVLVCSRNEAFGRVISESMLVKKPVIGTNTGGITELINEGYNGYLYDPGNYNQLADKIELLILNPGKIAELGENGFRFVNDNFTKENSGGKLADLLWSLAGKANLSSGSVIRFIRQSTLAAIQENERTAFGLEARLYQIQHSMLMQLLNIYQKTIEKLKVVNSRRRRLNQIALEEMGIISNKGLRTFLIKAKKIIMKKGR